LDAIYEYRIVELFHSVASSILAEQDTLTRYVHLDWTTLSFHGV